MAAIHDIAAYILKHQGAMTPMKLQKLCYYSQAWHLVWEDTPMTRARVEAWANGPIFPSLYRSHRGMFKLSPSDITGDPDTLDPKELTTVEAILKFYGKKTAHWLSELTHKEDPWKNARKGLAAGQRGNNQITHAAMAEYYASL